MEEKILAVDMRDGAGNIIGSLAFNGKYKDLYIKLGYDLNDENKIYDYLATIMGISRHVERRNQCIYKPDSFMKSLAPHFGCKFIHCGHDGHEDDFYKCVKT